MVVSTGVGGGIVVDGRLLDGADGNAGHVGHVIVEPDGEICGCGARGCVEAEASGTAIARRTGRPPAEADTELRVRTGRARRPRDRVGGEPARPAARGRQRFGRARLRRRRSSRAAQTEIDERCRLDFSRGTRVVPGALGGDGPLIGAAAVARFTSR